MPWKKTHYMNERVKFIATYKEKTKTFSDLCDDREKTSSVGPAKASGLEEMDNDVWKVYFGPIALGHFDGQTEYRSKNRYFGTMICIDGDVTSTKRRRHRR